MRIELPTQHGHQSLAPSAGELLEAIVSEIHGAAVRTAAVTSYVNALGSGQSLAPPQALTAILPQRPNVLDHLQRCEQELQMPGKSLAAVSQFYVSLGYGHAGVAAFCADADAWGLAKAAFLHRKMLSNVWRRLGCLALGAVTALDPQIKRCLPERYGQNTPILRGVLAKVIQGEWPCLDTNGQPVLPDLPQRRPAPRRMLNRPCVVEHQGKTVQAIVKDISSSGLGLERAPGMTPQKVALVELQGGRCLACVVVWAKGASAGLKFHTALHPNDPLLAG